MSQSTNFEDHVSVVRLKPDLTGEILTEDTAALQFIVRHGQDLRFCHDTVSWFRWNGTRWLKDKTGSVHHCARELARTLSENLPDKDRRTAGRTGFAAGIARHAKYDPRAAVTIDYWDSDPFLLGTPDGTVDLQSGELRPSDRAEGITKITSVSPSEDACARWIAFLQQATGDDAELIRFLQQWCGYCLTGSTAEQALVFVHGSGGNGKSVFLNTITAILADYAAVAAMTTFTASQGDKHPTDLAMLRGARLVSASETEEGNAWAESRIKQMTGSDPVTARFMRQDFFTFLPQFKLMIVGNHKPVLRNVDNAARRRFLIVPFDRKPEVPDRDLERKLRAEAPAILRWMIDGCLDWRVNGLVKPGSVLDATEEYFSDQDLFTHWLLEECICAPGTTDLSETSSRLFKSWKEFAQAAGNAPGSQQSFKETMTRHGYKFYRGRKAREFFGIALKVTGERQ